MIKINNFGDVDKIVCALLVYNIITGMLFVHLSLLYFDILGGNVLLR